LGVVPLSGGCCGGTDLVGRFWGACGNGALPVYVPVVTFIGPFEISDAVSADDEIWRFK
jgi:hypothetical protein